MPRLISEVARQLAIITDGAARSIEVRLLRMCSTSPKSNIERARSASRNIPEL